MGWGQQQQQRQNNSRLIRGNNNIDQDDRMDDENNNNNEQQQNQEDEQWGWRLKLKAVRPVPEFYPLDPRSIRRINLGVVDSMGNEEDGMIMMVDATNSIEEISNRISTACQSLSIHGVWDNLSPSTALSSMEQVEMVVNMYLSEEDDAGEKVHCFSEATLALECILVLLSPSLFEYSANRLIPTVLNSVSAYSSSSQQRPPSPRVLLVELQRRKGCSITFHNYRRCLLDAAEGKFDPESFHLTDGLEKPLGRDRCNQPRATLASSSRPGGLLARPSLRPPSYSADHASSRLVIAGLKTEGESSTSPDDDDQCKPMAVYEKAMKALNMAASLIHKDRVDARRLGLESLVLLTDPLRAGMETAHIASRVVLLGSAQEEHCGSSSMGMTNDDDVDALFDESSGLGIREKILEMILTDGAEDRGGSLGDSSTDGFEMIEQEFTDCLFNLCLTVLSNALQTMEGSNLPSFTKQQHDIIDIEEGEDRKPSPRARASTEPAVRPTAINIMEQQVSKRFIDDTNSTFGCDVLSSLIRILGQAKTNPHDAYHSARCLGVLFKGCGNSHKARARRDLDAKRIIAAALEVGSRSHAKLADASREAMVALVTDDEESMEEEQSPRQERMDLERDH